MSTCAKWCACCVSGDGAVFATVLAMANTYMQIRPISSACKIFVCTCGASCGGVVAWWRGGVVLTHPVVTIHFVVGGCYSRRYLIC